MNEISTHFQEDRLINPAQRVIDACLTGELNPTAVAALEKAMDVFVKMEDRNAARSFAQDFAAMQAELTNVIATKAVMTKTGSVLYRYAPFEEIMAQVSPALEKWGFSISFGSRIDGEFLIAILHITHRLGHTRTSEYAARTGGGSSVVTPAQNSVGTLTLAKRHALILALALTFDHSDDARLAGRHITAAQAQRLRERVRATQSHEAKFWRSARRRNTN